MSELGTLTKVCIRGARCVHPDGPELPATEEYFYVHKGAADRFQPYCKECWKAEGRRYRSRVGNKKDSPTNYGEGLVIAELKKHGIYAEKGAGGHHKYVDVVAWGCVRIEVKSSRMSDRGRFEFTIGRRANAFHSHALIVLVCMYPDNTTTFHVFRPEHPVFYRRGQLKRGVMFIPDAKNRKGRRYGLPLTDELMAEHQDRWDMIEECRLNWPATV